MLSLLSVQWNACVFRGIWGPPRTSKQFYLVNGQVTPQRQLGDRNDSSSLRGERVFFTCIVHGPNDQGCACSGWYKGFAEGCKTLDILSRDINVRLLTHELGHFVLDETHIVRKLPLLMQGDVCAGRYVVAREHWKVLLDVKVHQIAW